MRTLIQTRICMYTSVYRVYFIFFFFLACDYHGISFYIFVQSRVILYFICTTHYSNMDSMKLLVHIGRPTYHLLHSQLSEMTSWRLERCVSFLLQTSGGWIVTCLLFKIIMPHIKFVTIASMPGAFCMESIWDNESDAYVQKNNNDVYFRIKIMLDVFVYGCLNNIKIK